MNVSLLLGVALTFARTDGRELQLTVTLTEPATVSVSLEGATLTSTGTGPVHRFQPFSTPIDRAITATLSIAGEPPKPIVVPAIAPDRLRFVVYGDTRDGPGPHRALIEAIASAGASLIVHTGDLATTSGDVEDWQGHLRSTLKLAGIPAILSLGNHDLYVAVEDRGRRDAVAQALRYWPPPPDELAQKHNAPRTVYHTRVGPALFVNLDSNAPLGPETPQRKFLEAALADRGDARFVFVLFHHGPVSAGPHGGHPQAEGLHELFEKHGVTASLAGHDHTYQRIQHGKVTYVVSGGGGAPLYWRAQLEKGVKAFAPVYNWAVIDLSPEKVVLEAYGLDGALLDRAELGAVSDQEKGLSPLFEAVLVIGGAALLAIVLLIQMVQMVRR